MDGIWSQYTRRAIGILLVGVLMLMIYAARGVLAPLVMAGVLAFLIEPLVSYLNRRLRVPRVVAGLLVLLLLLALFLVAVMVLAPILVNQFSQVRFNVDDAVDGALEWLRAASESLRSFSVGGYELGLGPYVDSFQKRLEPSAVVGFLPSGQDLFGSIDSILSTTAGALAGFASSLGRLLLTLFLTLIYSLYLVSDGPRLASSAWSLVPVRHRPELEELQCQVVRVWRAFFRGQLLMVTLFGLSVGLVMWGLGLPSALMVGIMAGVMDLVPSIGALVAGGLAVLMALIQGSEHLAVGNGMFALIVLAVYLGLQQLESSVLQPRIMGRSVELPGIVIIVGIMAGASVAGILGAYLAVPVMATARVVGIYVHRKLTEGHGSGEPGEPDEPVTADPSSPDPSAAMPEGPGLEDHGNDSLQTMPETSA
ncbi:MAG: AI-2E family transporter [Actinobacteria bacterium]|nr:AI-2E family transporter [Actinomycetota bacterium]